jgi:hypothetical protein
MKKTNTTLFCPKNRHARRLAISTCCICEQLADCGVFKYYYRNNQLEYEDFVYNTLLKFPEKYQLEVIFMAEKKQFEQVVDQATGRVEQVIDMERLENLDAEGKLALTKGKTLYVVTHTLEPVIKIEMRKRLIETETAYTPVVEERPVIPMEEQLMPEPEPEPEPETEPENEPKPGPRGRKKQQ